MGSKHALNALAVALLLGGAGAHVSLRAQGEIGFNTTPSVLGYAAPVYDVDGVTKLSGAAYLAQLYVGAEPTSLSPVGVVAPFLTGLAAGLVRVPTLVVVPSIPPGALAIVQMRAWTGAAPSYETAVTTGTRAGASNVFQIRLGASFQLPASLIGLLSFHLVEGIPEPSTVALIIVGGGLLLRWHRVGPGSPPSRWR